MLLCVLFFFKQKTAYEMRISDWSSDVCSSDLVATLFLAIFSVGVALGSVLINRLLAGRVLAKYSPAAAIAMGLFIVHLYWNVLHWPDVGPGLVNLATFVRIPQAEWIMVALFGVAVAGGMFVVPLYAFFTTTVHKRSEEARVG